MKALGPGRQLVGEIPLRREDQPLLRQHLHETVQYLRPGAPHHIHVIEAGVGDDPHVASKHISPRHPLILGLQGHTLDHQDVRLLLGGLVQVSQLLPDVGGGAALNELLPAVGVDGDGQGARGLAQDPMAPGGEPRGDHAGHGGLAPGPVHIDHVPQRLPIPFRLQRLPTKVQQEQGRKDED